MTQTANAVLEHRVGVDGQVAIRIHTGDLEVRGTDGDTVRIRDLDGDDLRERFAIEADEGRISIRPRDRTMLDLGFLRHGGGSARLAVEVPRRARVALDTASGRLRAEGLEGDQRYRTASGAIDLTAVTGRLAIDAVSGSVDVTATGEIELSGRLVSGDLRLTGGRIRSLSVSTTSGDVDLLAPLSGPGPYAIQSVSGDAHVVVGEAGLRVEAKTVTGEVSTDATHQSRSGRGERTVVIGAGAALLAFKSISGDLRVAASAPGSGEELSHASLEPPAPPPPPDAPGPPVGSATVDFRGPDEPTAWSPDDSDAADSWTEERDERRLAILRDLESGAIDVATATVLLAELEDAVDD